MPKSNLTLKEKVTAFLARHGGNAEAAVTELLSDNLRYRERLRSAQSGGESPYKPDARIAELEGENQRLEQEVERLSLKVPAEGAIVLTGDQVKAHQAYLTLGKPEDVKRSLDELPALRTKVGDAERKTAATEAATILGWNPDATASAIGDKQLVVILVDGKDKDGKAVKVPHVRPASDEKAATVPLTEWMDKHAAYLMPALTAKSQQSGAASGTSSSTSTQGTPFTVQSAGGSPAAPSDPVAEFAKKAQAERDARPNPLIPRKAAVNS